MAQPSSAKPAERLTPSQFIAELQAHLRAERLAPWAVLTGPRLDAEVTAFLRAMAARGSAVTERLTQAEPGPVDSGRTGHEVSTTPGPADRRDELLALWRQHRDADALAILLAAVPDELPKAALRQDRDTELRRIAAALRLDRPAAPAYRIARLIEAAARQLEAGRAKLSGRAFADLSTDEAAALGTAVKAIIRRGQKIPRWRQLIDIIC